MIVIAGLLAMQAVTLALVAMFDDGDLTARQRLFAMALALADAGALVHVLS